MELEYKVIELNNLSNMSKPIKLQEELNNYGKEGWELVSIFYPPQEGEGWMPKSDCYSVVLKRQIIKNKVT